MLRSPLPQFSIATSRDWVEVAGGDFARIPERGASVPAYWHGRVIRDR